MSEERYKQIKDSVELQKLVRTQIGIDDELLQEEIELLNAYEQLRNNWNELIQFLETNWKETQDIWYVKIINKMKEIY